MTGLGKIDRELFDSVIARQLGADRADVAIGPTHGVDFGVLSLGQEIVVVATDPVSILPGLGFETAGRLALDIVLADVAVSGIAPTHVTISLTLPPSMSDTALERTWTGLAGHAESLGVAVVAGHTARYPGIDFSWVGGATALGVGDPDALIRPDGAEPGDAIIISTGPAAEIAGLFASLFEDQLDLTDAELAAAKERLSDIETVEDANRVAAVEGVSAMHDATEGGFVSALHEMAAGAGCRFEIDREPVPLQPGVEAVCSAVDVDPWLVSSAGSLVVTADVDAAQAVVDALVDIGTPAAVCGRVVDGEGVTLDGTRVTPPVEDPAWEAFARLTEQA